MKEAGDQPTKMAEVAGLAAAIADRIFQQHEEGTSIPPEQFRLFVRAAQMLVDNGVPWPPSVAHLVMEVAKRVEQAQAKPDATPAMPQGDDVVVHLTQYLGATKRT